MENNIMNKTFVWILFLIACLVVACSNASVTIAPAAMETSQPKSLPVEFIWKIIGDPNPFNALVGVAVDLQRNIYVMDTKNSCIQKSDSDGKFILMWGGPVDSGGQFTIIVPDESRLPGRLLCFAP
jgi:hypothetical protein